MTPNRFVRDIAAPLLRPPDLRGRLVMKDLDDVDCWLDPDSCRHPFTAVVGVAIVQPGGWHRLTVG
jgi:hypothetical protein